MGLRLHQGRRRRHQLRVDAQHASRPDREQGAQDEHYLLEVDNELVVPVGKKIRVITTAADVIHSWWVPAFGAKQDAIPGFLRDLWFKPEVTGTFRSQCVELCGKEHGFMPIVVRVVSQEDYGKWVGEQKQALLAQADDPNKNGIRASSSRAARRSTAANCVACHQATGKACRPRSRRWSARSSSPARRKATSTSC